MHTINGRKIMNYVYRETFQNYIISLDKESRNAIGIKFSRSFTSAFFQ